MPNEFKISFCYYQWHSNILEQFLHQSQGPPPQLAQNISFNYFRLGCFCLQRMNSSITLFKNREILECMYAFLILKSQKLFCKFVVSNNVFLINLFITDLTSVVTDRTKTRTGSQIQMILHIPVTVHARQVNSMYYNFFADNEKVEKYRKLVLPTATREI